MSIFSLKHGELAEGLWLKVKC